MQFLMLFQNLESKKWHRPFLTLFWLKYCHSTRFLSGLSPSISTICWSEKAWRKYLSIQFDRAKNSLSFEILQWKIHRNMPEKSTKIKNRYFDLAPLWHILSVIFITLQKKVQMSWNFGFVGFQTCSFILWNQIAFLKFVICHIGRYFQGPSLNCSLTSI